MLVSDAKVSVESGSSMDPNILQGDRRFSPTAPFVLIKEC